MGFSIIIFSMLAMLFVR